MPGEPISASVRRKCAAVAVLPVWGLSVTVTPDANVGSHVFHQPNKSPMGRPKFRRRQRLRREPAIPVDSGGLNDLGTHGASHVDPTVQPPRVAPMDPGFPVRRSPAPNRDARIDQDSVARPRPGIKPQNVLAFVRPADAHRRVTGSRDPFQGADSSKTDACTEPSALQVES